MFYNIDAGKKIQNFEMRADDGSVDNVEGDGPNYFRIKMVGYNQRKWVASSNNHTMDEKGGGRAGATGKRDGGEVEPEAAGKKARMATAPAKAAAAPVKAMGIHQGRVGQQVLCQDRTTEAVVLEFADQFELAVSMKGPDLLFASMPSFRWTDAAGGDHESAKVVVQDDGWERTSWGAVDAATVQAAGITRFKVYYDAGESEPHGCLFLTVVNARWCW